MIVRSNFGLALAALTCCLAWHAPLSAQGEQTADGLERVKGRFPVTFLRPGASFDKYSRVAMLDCLVEFREDWLQAHNRGKTSATILEAEDEERIKQEVANEFQSVFSEVLGDDSKYEVIAPAVGADVLVLRPALLKVNVGADVYGAQGFNSPVSGVVATLYLEFYDSASGTILARVMDQQSDAANDRTAVRRVFRRWARNVVRVLQEGFK
jgi:hypothetical protein